MADNSNTAVAFHELKFHQGEALCKIAAHYPKLLEVVLEQTQNALDAEAKKIWITINFKTLVILVQDNGFGASIEKFNEALCSVGKGIKTKDALGRFGIGLISPLGKCEEHTFTSRPKFDREQDGYQEWSFVGRSIKAQKDQVVIPRKPRKELSYGSNSKKNNPSVVPWLTQVKIRKFKNDRIISQITRDMLTSAILERYRHKMKKLGTRIAVRLIDQDKKVDEWTFHAKEYSGRRLPEVAIENEEGGRSTFKLYLAKKTPKGRRGKISVGEFDNDFRFEFDIFVKSTNYLSEEISIALSSGIFEGEIISSKATLLATRRGFEENKALFGFCVAIEDWYKDYGREYLLEVQEERREKRFQQLGLRSMKVIEEMLKQDKFSGLAKIIQQLRQGTIGAGHTNVGKKAIGQQNQKALSTRGQPGKEKGATKNKGNLRHAPSKEHSNHHPFSVQGPKGSNRTTVKSSSLGLQFSYEGLENSSLLWDFNTKAGILFFNTRHPLWEQCSEGGDKALMKLQEHITLNALVLQTMPEEAIEWVKLGFDEMLEPFIFTLVHADKFAGRRPGRKPKSRK